jgi:predicted transposase YdaD
LFDLIDDRPVNADQYRFDSVAIKEPKFEIDGVFLPPERDEPGCVYFCEIQFQKDAALYERLFSESLLYFYRNAALFSDWKAVVIYPSHSLEQTKRYPHRSLLNGPQVHQIYLDELAFNRVETLSQWLVEALGRQLAEPLGSDRQSSRPIPLPRRIDCPSPTQLSRSS